MVYVIVGSKHDLPVVAKSKFEVILNAVGIKFKVHVISAHRNPSELKAFCASVMTHELNVFVAVAGWAAALAGAIAAETQGWFPVIGVPLPGGPYQNDSLYSMASMPPGRPVLVVPNLDNAAIAAVQIITFGVGAGNFRTQMREYLAKSTPEPSMNVNLADHRKKE